MPVADQSATFNSLLDAVETVIKIATGLSNSYVLESYDEERPREGEPYVVVYRFTDENPFMYAGAAEKSHSTFLVLEVVLYTRFAVDKANSDKKWSRDSLRGALVMRHKIANALQDKRLFASYSATGVPTGEFLTVEPVQQLMNPGPQKKSKDKTYGEHHMFFQVKTVQSLFV